jgi:hypothetical protein
VANRGGVRRNRGSPLGLFAKCSPRLKDFDSSETQQNLQRKIFDRARELLAKIRFVPARPGHALTRLTFNESMRIPELEPAGSESPLPAPSPYTINLMDNVTRLKLDVARVVHIHGGVSPLTGLVSI